MNLWQMNGRNVASKVPGYCTDDTGKQHASIHPSGNRRTKSKHKTA
jgi:hypothetical protein